MPPRNGENDTHRILSETRNMQIILVRHWMFSNHTNAIPLRVREKSVKAFRARIWMVWSVGLIHTWAIHSPVGEGQLTTSDISSNIDRSKGPASFWPGGKQSSKWLTFHPGHNYQRDISHDLETDDEAEKI